MRRKETKACEEKKLRNDTQQGNVFSTASNYYPKSFLKFSG